ncbi:MAG TPA: carboxypeptidase regulatory-like domain-containing protein, partial [Candidatus Sulfotelmatobacter sp.]
STTSLRGTISDPSGAAVVGAKVTLSSVERGFERSTTTGGAGGYEFLQLPPGNYRLTVETAGFRRAEQKQVQLLVDTPATINVKLEVGTPMELVEVNAEAAVINTTDSSLGNAFNELQVKSLPLEGRNVPDLLSLQNGVAYTGNRSDVNKDTDTRSGAVNGARSDQSNITLDGVDVNDEVNAYAFTSVLPVTLDSVQEFRVTTTNYGAEEGRSSGAQVSLVTKSGTNNFHGAAYEYLRNTYTSANDYFVKQSELESGSPNVAPKLIRNIFGGAVGGPVLRNRLYFFLNYEAARQREESSVVRIVPSDALRAGFITYHCQDESQCPGGAVPGDPTPVPAGYKALTPDQIAQMDPLHVGNNPVVLSYFNTFPHANDFSQGDNFNFVGYRFRGPVPTDKNWYIARLDYKINSSGTHSLFWRGALRNDKTSDVPYLPGTGPIQTKSDNSSGFTVGYTATFRPTLLNNFHWGYTRQSIGNPGNTNTPVIYFRGLNDDSLPNNSTLAYVYSRSYTTPVQNFVDDVSWTKGTHSIEFGANIRFIRNPRTSFENSFPSGTTNSSGLDSAGIANTFSPLDPGNNGFPAVNTDFNLNYNYPLIAMMGLVSQLNATYNFDKTGTALPLGAPLKRHYAANEFEFYLQDSWRMRKNLTINYGLRYALLSPPWETTGTQVAPTISLGQWFEQRQKNMRNGIGAEADPIIEFGLAGAANGKPGYYNWDYHNFAPRLSFAYNPRPKTVIRGGAGVVYDRIGAGLLSTFDRDGAFGLSTGLTNSLIPSAATAPRLNSLTQVPCCEPNGTNIFPPQPKGGFPFVFPAGGTGLAIYWGLDNSIKTPYSYALDLTVGQQVARDMTFELSYVGHLSRRLLSQEDMAMPLDIVDKKSKINYVSAANRMSQLGAAGTPTSAINAAAVGPTAAYWQNMIQPLAPGDAYSLACSGGFTTDPVQAMYDLFSCGGGPMNGFGDETTPLAQLDYWGSDFSGTPGILGQSGNYYTSVLGPNSFFNSQFHSLFAWRSMGSANYNALQATLRKSMSRGVQFDLNYTFSKSIDLTSDAVRVGENGGLSTGVGGIVNTWSPNQLRGTSDFDATHQFNANWVIELPFGKGKSVAGKAHGFAQAVIGGWQLSGLTRWTSGFPVNISNGATWPTNWQLPGNATTIGPTNARTTKVPASGGNGAYVSLFPTPLPELPNGLGLGPFRHDFPGESGSRNPVRGDGFATLDASLSKAWTMPYSDSHLLRFRWEVFNVPNLTRFDVASITNGLDQGAAFGKYSGLLTNPRVMQFALRYEF